MLRLWQVMGDDSVDQLVEELSFDKVIFEVLYKVHLSCWVHELGGSLISFLSKKTISCL